MNQKQQDGPVVYVDGENFSFRAAETLIANKIISKKNDINSFDLRYLFQQSFGRNDLEIRYYGTRVRLIRNPDYLKTKTREIINRHRILRNSLSSQNIEFVESGRLKVRDGDICRKCNNQDRHLQEKGVDVKIAIDLVIDSQPGRKLYLVSSDTDLLPAIKASNAHTVYVGFPKTLSRALSDVADEVLVLRDPEIIDAYNRAGQPRLIK